MAYNILRLRVESSEYDAKLKKAAEGIRHLAEVAHTGGGELTGLERAELDYVKALGTMETKSRTAAGSVRELESTYKELKVIYDQLNEVEKADEGGKALAASLEQIKTRAQEARTQLDNASKSLNDNGQSAQQSGGILESLAGKLTLNIDAMKLFDMGLSAVKVALDVAKDAFFASETNVDEWGRTLQSADGIYQSFLQSLNTSDFSGFLNNIGQVTQAAREAYNALDELGTRMTIINPERAKLQARQQELRADIRRNGADSEVGRAALAELKKIEPLLSKSFKTESQMNYTAFEKLVRERLAEGGINLDQRSFQQFMKTFSSDAAFQQMRNNARGSITSESTGNAYNPNATVTRRRVDTRNTEQKLLDLFTDEWRQANSGYLTASFSAQGAAASNALGNARYMRAGSGGGKGGKSGTTDSEKELTIQQQIAKLEEEAYTATDERRIAIAKQVQELDQILERQKTIRDQVHGMKAQPEGMTFTAAQLEGMSFDNQMPTARGNRGRAQDKLDLATAAFATGGTSNVDFSNYINGIKNAMSNANLGDELYTSMTEKLKDATTVSTLLQEMMERGLAGADLESAAQALKEKLLSPEGIDQTAVQSFLEGVGLKLNADTGEVTDDKDKGGDGLEDMKKFNEGIGKLSGGLSQVTGGLKAVGVEIPKEVDQVIGVVNGVSQIISGVGTIISIFGTSAMTANTTAVGLNTAAIGGLIAALEFNSATNFFGLANGGIVPAFAQGGLIGRAAGGMMIPGNSMSGDRLRLPVDGGRGVIGVNSGELILNKSSQNTLAASLLQAESLVDSINDYRVSLGNAQQSMIANALEGGGSQIIDIDWVMRGEDMRAVINNNGRRTGRGEIVQSRRNRS